MAVNFGLLTIGANSCQPQDISPHAAPNETARDLAESGLGAGVGDPVETGENPRDPRPRDQGAGRALADVAKESGAGGVGHVAEIQGRAGT